MVSLGLCGRLGCGLLVAQAALHSLKFTSSGFVAGARGPGASCAPGRLLHSERGPGCSESSLAASEYWRHRARTAARAAGEAEVVAPSLGSVAFRGSRRTSTKLPGTLKRLHEEAVSTALEGFQVGLKRVTVLMPSGLGHGEVGAKMIAKTWAHNSKIAGFAEKNGFRALALVPFALLHEAKEAYTRQGRNDLLVLVMPGSPEGTDLVADALLRSPSLLVLCAYEDVNYCVMALKRCRQKSLDLAVFEMAHGALGVDPAVKEAVFEWSTRYRVRLSQALYITSRSLEANPLRGLDAATTRVPGLIDYRVVAEQGGIGGPEVFALTTAESQKRGITLPVRLVIGFAENVGGKKVNGRTPQAQLLRVAGAVAKVCKVLSLKLVTAAPMTDEDFATFDAELTRGTGGTCLRAFAEAPEDQEPESDGLLLHGTGIDIWPLAQALGRLAFAQPGKRALYVLVPEGTSQAAAVAWQVLMDYDVRTQEALREAAVASGRLGRPLAWGDLPRHLRELVVTFDTKAGRAAGARLVNSVVSAAKALDWDRWYGRLLAYRVQEGAPQMVPTDARIHGYDIGLWVARQFMEWRFGSLPKEKQHLLMVGGLSLEEETDRYFAEGLVEFERHWEDNGGDPFVATDYFTHTGFPLGAWSVQQRAAWRRGTLSAEQQYLLDRVGFQPVAHPASPPAREITMLLEGSIREAQLKSVFHREKLFKSLVLKYHPYRCKSPYAEEATRFLAGYREWFLNPPEPPLPVEPEEEGAEK